MTTERTYNLWTGQDEGHMYSGGTDRPSALEFHRTMLTESRRKLSNLIRRRDECGLTISDWSLDNLRADIARHEALIARRKAD